MGEILPVASLARHGETAWSLSGRRAGLTDPPLTEPGYEHECVRPVIRLWNDTRHVERAG